ncbi:hypothetical protein IWZ01DRAFT_488999 [Phyllosticta capitalensis]
MRRCLLSTMGVHVVRSCSSVGTDDENNDRIKGGECCWTSLTQGNYNGRGWTVASRCPRRRNRGQARVAGGGGGGGHLTTLGWAWAVIPGLQNLTGASD